MRSYDLQSQLTNYTIAHAPHEAQRAYIGLSGMGDCDRAIYDRYLHGRRVNVRERMKYSLGYDMERLVVARLTEMGLYSPGKEICLYGGLVQGHTDGFIGADLLEIKTIQKEEQFPDPGHLPNKHFWQVQAYLHYTGIQRAHILYVARDTGAYRVIGVARHEAVGCKITEKVERLVRAVRLLQRPACTCGYCDRKRGAAQAAGEEEAAGE